MSRVPRPRLCVSVPVKRIRTPIQSRARSQQSSFLVHRRSQNKTAYCVRGSSNLSLCSDLKFEKRRTFFEIVFLFSLKKD
jgi:hypothetical protein